MVGREGGRGEERVGENEGWMMGGRAVAVRGGEHDDVGVVVRLILLRHQHDIDTGTDTGTDTWFIVEDTVLHTREKGGKGSQ